MFSTHHSECVCLFCVRILFVCKSSTYRSTFIPICIKKGRGFASLYVCYVSIWLNVILSRLFLNQFRLDYFCMNDISLHGEACGCIQALTSIWLKTRLEIIENMAYEMHMVSGLRWRVKECRNKTGCSRN